MQSIRRKMSEKATMKKNEKNLKHIILCVLFSQTETTLKS